MKYYQYEFNWKNIIGFNYKHRCPLRVFRRFHSLARLYCCVVSLGTVYLVNYAERGEPETTPD